MANTVGAPPRLLDVAAAAGVSLRTASRVLNGDSRVATATRDRVRAAMDELEFEPDMMARSLRAGTDTAVSCVVESIADPFFAEVVDAVEAEMAARGRAVLVASTHQDQPRQDAIIRRMVQRRTAGLIIAPTGLAAGWLESASTPVVLVDRGEPGASADLVDVDDRQAAFEAVAHLIRHGHRNIAYVGDTPLIPTSAARLRGYRDALEHSGIGVPEHLVAANAATTRDAAQIANAFVDAAAHPGGPTAFFSATTRASLGIVPVLHSRQRTDLAFVGFGDFPLADALDPRVTVVDHSGRRVGQAAARRLLARLDDVHLPAKHIQVSTPIIARGSGELRP